MRSILLCALSLVVALVAARDGCYGTKDVYETLVISSGSGSPDCVTKSKLLLVNGSFTGPTLTMYKGDKLHLTIVNQLDSMFSMHIHGATQFGTPFSDGAAGINAIPMGPHSTVTRSTIMYEAGTFFYHAHLKLMDMHVYGALIVKEHGEEYDDLVVMLSDYWHADLDALHYGLLEAPAFQFVGLPQSFLTNGRGNVGNCSAGADTSYTTLRVKPRTTYRLRIIGGTSLFGVHFRIPQHKLTVVEIEGTKVVPKAVDYVEVLPGQRYTALLNTDQPIDNYFMQIDGRWRGGAPATASRSATPPSTLLPYVTETVNFMEQFEPTTNLNMPTTADLTVHLQGKQIAFGADGKQRRWAMNNITYVKQMKTSVLEAVIANQLGALPDNSRPSISIKKGQVVDVVLENAVALNGVCEMHPWHLHGHSFWVVGAGAGAYDAAAPLSTKPFKRDVVGVYPYHAAYNQPLGTAGAPCGWTRIRFVADNVGVWPLHCHVASHFDMGMATVFVVGEDDLHNPEIVAALRAASA
ncbi:hypothetical protein SPRG_01703 [Saprolegnia parasitica CBS 223.65]|uniref:L-ascorbate oxidase n=1 Tax=Saprolegnia parasitica (strain CBS 223.65) TaxID=695850 RepID=A0A067CT04_SAPPC|nr:hypothetical protein SPRG_01703 [Saprolegnia parasitica CBS 223.65]KDO33824.1 hypothetical protein SPRG_01703 [Saprolegnia parasitica CBS 223.65]|eukprot:XP_012195460.1 hypothetical protein SPRG_01703 [Saprolegnia parasitica CBS 223.65]